jgi:flagellar operon protein
VSIQGIDGVGRPGTSGAAPGRVAPPAGGPSFADVLKSRSDATRSDAVRFSGHALERIQRRNIPLDGPVAARLQAGVDKAAAKGVRDSLVLVDDTAFVVSVRNRTVVTAVDRDNMKEHVFTNIDGAVIA